MVQRNEAFKPFSFSCVQFGTNFSPVSAGWGWNPPPLSLTHGLICKLNHGTLIFRTSYLPNEILWGHRFESMLLYRKEYNLNMTPTEMYINVGVGVHFRVDPRTTTDTR